MRRCGLVIGLLGLVACGGGGGGAGSIAAALPREPAATAQEMQCQAAGWRREVIDAAGLQRLVLWKAPASGSWSRGAIVVMHGGGGSHTNFCVANVDLIAAQVRFTEQALARGYAVFLLDSSDRVNDIAGRLCGKIWDDEVRPRDSLDLPFLEQLLRQRLPALRPAGSRSELYLTGLSSGGFMTVRTATRFGDLVTAFAPVAAGDPYGWTRDCTPRAGDRPNVFGIAIDNETRRPISEVDACRASAYPNEKTWESAARKPPYRLFHHAQDGTLDRSCVDKLQAQLQSRGYAGGAPFMLDGGPRSADVHFWQDGYNTPLLDFFDAQR